MSPRAGTLGVVVCADDFALNEGVSRGIADLAAQARISAASVMTLSPRWPADAALLQPVRGAIDVGLHLDWTSDFALVAGHGLSLAAAMRRAVLGGFERQQAEVVIARQLDLFEAHWQATPDYVDGHQHVQQFSGIREALVAVLSRRYGAQAVKPYLRVSRALPGGVDLKSRVIAAMGATALARLAADAGLPCSQWLSGVYDFKGSAQRYAALMDGWLARAAPGGIMMCHPAQTAEPGDAIGAARVQEFAFLQSEAFPAALKRAGVTLVRGAALWRH